MRNGPADTLGLEVGVACGDEGVRSGMAKALRTDAIQVLVCTNLGTLQPTPCDVVLILASPGHTSCAGPLQALCQVQAWLKPGGQVLTVVPSPAAAQWMEQELTKWRGLLQQAVGKCEAAVAAGVGVYHSSPDFVAAELCQRP